jgi:sirohydrochlorin cobaltochelatase
LARGLILFAHGSRDPRWAEPFLQILHRVRQSTPDIETRLAYLELMHPDLESSVRELAELPVESMRVIPLFLSQGSHLRQDLPRQIARLQAIWPDIPIECAAPLGESSGMLDSIAEYCISSIN